MIGKYQIISAVAISSDGFIAGHSSQPSSEWVSKEDSEFFAQLLKDHKFRLMGSSTFLANITSFNLRAKDVTRIVLSRKLTTQQVMGVPGTIIMAGKIEDIETAINALEKQIFDGDQSPTILILGGQQVYEDFLPYIDKFYITRESIELKHGIEFLPNMVIFKKYMKLSTTRNLSDSTILEEWQRR